MPWRAGDKRSRPATLTLSLKPHNAPLGANRLREGDLFALALKSTDPGPHLTTFNIYPDGRVSLLQKSQPLATYQEIPPLAQRNAEGGIFDAHLVTLGVPVQDIFVVVATTERLDTSPFTILKTDRGPLTGEYSYQLHEFMTWLDKQRDILREIAMLHVQTMPRESKSAPARHRWREDCVSLRQDSDPMHALGR